MMALRLRDIGNRTLRFADSYNGEMPDIPAPVAGGYWRWDSGLNLVFTSAVNDAGNYTSSVTGAVTRTVNDKLDDIPPNAKDVGVVADAVLGVDEEDAPVLVSGTDNAAALNLLFQIPNRIVQLPKGYIYYNANLTDPQCAGIIGEGEYDTILVPGPDVTAPLRINYPVARATGFKVDGRLTTEENTGGIIWGDDDGDNAGAMIAECVRTAWFAHSGGMTWQCMLKSTFTRVTSEGCSPDYYVEGTAAFPTTIIFNQMIAASGPDIALRIRSGSDLTFNDFMADSSLGPSIVIVTGDNIEATRIIFNHPRFENNTALEDDDDRFEYDIVIDGTGGGTAKVDVEMNSPHWNYAARNALHVFGENAYCHMTNPRFKVPGAGLGKVSDGAILDCPMWPSNHLGASFIIEDTAKSGDTPTVGFNCPQANAMPWDPTVTSEVGDVEDTFADLTITRSRFRFYGGKWMSLELVWSGTLNAVTPAWIGFSMPGNLASLFADAYDICGGRDNNIEETNRVRVTGTGVIEQTRLGGMDYTSGSVVGGFIEILVELA
jgi:hypothetical protein